ncbi:MAG: hypothetical protein ACT6S0_14335 [Roseateles sp.]|uniref:hypothetical protein n=1 Tax=Roseateles sp. TaxID=1971397 RepID=UPI0040377D8C
MSSWLLLVCGVWLVGLGAYFIFLRPALLPEDQRFMGTSIDALRSAAPELERWLGKVFTVMGGFMAGAGVLVVFIARTLLPVRARGTATTLAVAGFFTVALMSASNFVLHSDFRWLLPIPALVWLASVVSYLAKR